MARHFLSGLALSQELHNCAPWASGWAARSFWLFHGCHDSRTEPFPHASSEEGLVVLQSFNGRDEIASGVGLQQKTASACIQNRAHRFIRVSNGQDEHASLRILAQIWRVASRPFSMGIPISKSQCQASAALPARRLTAFSASAHTSHAG